jgi:hypothetical protein
MPLSLETLAANAEAVEKLSFTSDFELETDAAGEPLYFSVDGVADVARLGRDGAGGDFLQLLPSQRVLYVSSEGQAGVVAADIGEFVALLVACPYWRDILKYSANGDLHQMRRAAAALAATYEDDEDLDEAREFFGAQFGLAEPADPVGALHRCASSGVVVRTRDGGPCMSLFNRFTVEDTPFLRGLVD